MTANGKTPSWQGIHHVALVTPDLDETIRFYQDVLGMQLLFTAPAGDMHGRHAALLPGQGFIGLHFFEMPNAQLFTPPDLQTMYWLPGALHHISFALPNQAEGEALRVRLEAHGVNMTPIMDQGNLLNFIFQDHNGMVLEAGWEKPA